MAAPTNCPHCKAGLHAHGGVNEGFHHCNSCGCCFDEKGNLREGNTLCSIAAGKQAAVDQSQLLNRIAVLEASASASGSEDLAALQKTIADQQSQLDTALKQIETLTPPKTDDSKTDATTGGSKPSN